MTKESISQEFRLKNIDERRNYFIEEINQIEVINKNRRKVCAVFNYIDQLLVLVSTVTGCVFISAFASLVNIPAGTACSAVGLKIVIITVTAGKLKSITQ